MIMAWRRALRHSMWLRGHYSLLRGADQHSLLLLRRPHSLLPNGHPHHLLRLRRFPNGHSNRIEYFSAELGLGEVHIRVL